MAEATPTIGIEDATAHLRNCLAPGGDGRLGVEIEWLVVDVSDPRRSLGADEVLAAASGPVLPNGGRVSVEPGGQLELSATAYPDAGAAWRATVDDAGVLRRRMERAGLELVPVGLDPMRSAPLSVHSTRYRAIDESFSRAGPSAMHMATNSAGLQLNIDLGADPLWTWRVAGLLGPVLVALFANSPAQHGAATGWASTRQLLWQTVPDRRAAPVPTWSVDAWVDHALDLQVLLMGDRDGDGNGAAIVREPLTFRRWILDGHVSGHPTVADLDRHLTTIFPPVRPRGWLELRMLDSVPDDGVAVAIAIGATILRASEPGRRAADACRRTAGRWTDAARHGGADPALASAGVEVLRIAAETVDDPDLAAACRDWSDRYPSRRRSPADDQRPGAEDFSRP